MKACFMFALAALAAAPAPADRAPAAFDSLEKQALRSAAAEVAAALRKTDGLSGKAVTLMPVRGDRDGYAERLLVGALVNAGMTVVVPNDENDPRFRKILQEIKWDGRQVRLGSIEPATVDELGRLRSTQVFVEAAVDLKRSAPGENPSAEAELDILAYAIATKSYVGAANKVCKAEKPVAPPPPPPPSAWTETAVGCKIVPVRVKISKKPRDPESEALAGRIDTAVRGALSDAGYDVSAGAEVRDTVVLADETVTLEVSRTVYDKSGEYEVHEGKVDVSVCRKARGGAVLAGKTSVEERGARKLGPASADKDLAGKLAGPVVEWLKKTLERGAPDVCAAELELRLAKPISTAADAATVDRFLQPFSLLDGVRFHKLAMRDDAGGRLRFFVVYDRSKFPGGFVPAYFAAAPELGDLLAK